MYFYATHVFRQVFPTHRIQQTLRTLYLTLTYFEGGPNIGLGFH